ncbi:MAG: TonB-dependent receptor domain-containing protein, partial [Bacteroidota bacterium]
KPEQVRSIEFGYTGLIGDKILFDIAYYYNSYTNFITQLFLRKSAGPIDFSVPQTGFIFDSRTEQNVRNAQTLLTPGSFSTVPGGPLVENSFSTYTNFNQEVTSQGISSGLEYSLQKGYRVTGNYNWNRLNTDLSKSGFLAEFNTPEHKFNLGFGNRKLTDKIGFNVNYRYQNAFLWESTFAQGIVPEVGVVDAQVSYKLKNIKSMIKIGGSNLTNERYVLNYGGPTLGAVYYVSITFDELMN